MTKDYYKILHISENSTQEEIKSAYRMLARKWHPDVAGNSEDVIVNFKDINEAYETLSNEIKKADYDKARRFYSYSGFGASANNGGKNGEKKDTYQKEKKEENQKTTSKQTYHTKDSFKFSWEDFFFKTQRQEKDIAKKGKDIYSDIEISIFEALGGTTKVINMLQTNLCPKCHGRKFVNGSECPFCKGKGETSTYKRFNVRIPAGISDKSKIRLAGEGEKGINGGVNGDLYLTVHIREPKGYKTEGLNILKTVPVTPFEAVLGANIVIPTLTGNVSLKIAPNTRNGQKIRLSGCGIEQNNKFGDMIVTVEIQIPKNLSEEEINLYKRLAEISTSTVR